MLFTDILHTFLISAKYLFLCEKRPTLVFPQLQFLADASCILSQHDALILCLKTVRQTLCLYICIYCHIFLPKLIQFYLGTYPNGLSFFKYRFPFFYE
jgi:hypothetical protein